MSRVYPTDECLATDEARFWGERQTSDLPDHRLRARTSSPQELWEDPDVEEIARGAYVDRILAACSPPAMDILELACGCGWLALELARAGHNVRGIDLSEERLESARNYALELRKAGHRMGGLEYEAGDLRAIPLPTSAYDRVVCWDGLHHIAPIGPLMERIHDALRPGGQLLLFDHIGPASRMQAGLDRALAGLAVAVCQPATLPKLFRAGSASHRAPSEDATGPEMIDEARRVFGAGEVRVETTLGLGKRWLARLRGPRRVRLGLVRTVCFLDSLWIKAKILRGEYVYLSARRAAVPVLLALAAVLSMTPAGGEPADDDPIARAEQDLRQQGWVVDSIDVRGADVPGLRHLIASGRIAAPARDVWTVISRPDYSSDNWPSLKEVVVESVIADTTISRYAMAVPVYPDRRYRLRSVSDAANMRFSFELIPGYGNVHEIKGCWTVSALGDSLCRAIYVLDTDPGTRLVPGFIVSWATRKTIPRSFAYLRDRSLKLSRSEPLNP